ncbi:hypothetical protein B9Z19DRAFT_1033850, partial [Tuber borchii]
MSNSPPPPPPPPRTGMSGLYANLLDPSNNTTTSTSISRAPIVFKQPPAASSLATSTPTPAEDPAPKKLNAAALRFQPTLKRPTGANAKGKGKNVRKPGVSATMAAAAGVTAGTADAGADTAGGGGGGGPGLGGGVARPIVKTTIEDWTGDADDDVNGFYANNRDQRRAGRKKRKKNRDTPPPPTNWDDVYDPSRPNSYDEYKDSDEKIRELEDWRDRVLPRRRRDSYDSEEDERERDRDRPGLGNRFAPPAKYSFAPPPQLSGGNGDTGVPPPPSPPAAAIGPPVAVPDDASGEDAYARRLRMSQLGSAGYSAATTTAATAPESLPPPPPPPPPPPAADPTPQPTISRAPILYTTPQPPTDTPANEPTDQSPPSPPSNPLLPGQKDFATRLMSKLGWRAGTGLGASSTGIIQPLRAVHTKSKDHPTRGKIIDKNKPNPAAVGKFGPSSVVVVLRHMVDGLEGEDEAVLVQEIGEECESSYGGVERVLDGTGAKGASRVFVKFSQELAALRAVNALEGRLFNGNTIEARFFDKDKFE